jgi:hypothetical protein
MLVGVVILLLCCLTLPSQRIALKNAAFTAENAANTVRMFRELTGTGMLIGHVSDD